MKETRRTEPLLHPRRSSRPGSGRGMGMPEPEPEPEQEEYKHHASWA